MLSNEITTLAVMAGIEVFEGFDIREFLLSAGSLDPMIDEMETWATNLVPVDDSQREEAAAKLKKASNNLDKLRKKVVTELKEEPKTIDANVREARKRIEAIEAELMRPIREKEARANKLRIFADLPNRLTAAPLAQLREELYKTKAMDTSPEIWLEKAAEAYLVNLGVAEALEAMIAKKEQEEADRAELERFRQQAAQVQPKPQPLAADAYQETKTDLCAVIRTSKSVGDAAAAIIEAVKSGKIRNLTFGG